MSPWNPGFPELNKKKKTLNFSAKTKISLLPEDKRKKSQEVRKYVSR